MDYVLLEMLALVGGFFLLARGSDSLVEGGENIARHYRVSPLTIGLTVVAWGTSLPELVITTWSSLHGKVGESLGTVVGSNVANLGLVLGSCAVILPATIENRVRWRDALWLLGALVLTFAALYDGKLTRLDGALLLGAFAFYQFGLLRAGKAEGQTGEYHGELESHLGKDWVKVLLGSLAIGVGARTAMWGGEALATRVGMAETVIGLTVFAVGTSLPELFAGVASARRGQAAIGLGNILGSNVFNVLAALGAAGVARPLLPSPEVVSQVLYRDIPTAMAFSLLLLVLPFLPQKWGRWKGKVVLAGYFGYIGFLMVHGVDLPK